MSDILVVYYSRSGKTRLVAQKLAEILAADLEEITEKTDRSGPMGYLLAGRDTVLNHPAELTSRHSVEGKKVVVIGMPVWAFAPPPAIRAYLSAVDLTGKKVCGFATMDGSGADHTLKKLAQLVPGGLAERLPLKRPRPDDPTLILTLTQWAARIKAAAK
jgi:flavodoxin